MNEDEIIAMAQREMAARRARQPERPPAGAGRLRSILVGLVFAIPAIFLAAPGSLPHKLHLSMGGMCGLRPSHSYFAGAMQLPLESRMVGIYGGFLLSLLALIGMGRLGSRRLGGKAILALMVVGISSMVLDGFNSLLMEQGLPHLYETTNLIRLVTGLASGIGLALLMTWLTGAFGMPKATGEELAVVRSPLDLAVLVLVNALYAVVVVQELAIAYYPIALIGVIGGLGLVAMTALLVILSQRRYANKIVYPRQLLVPGSLALVVGYLIVAAMAAARWSATGGMV